VLCVYTSSRASLGKPTNAAAGGEALLIYAIHTYLAKWQWATRE
jgi:hypothetical protein